jgi:hypothetical protein
MTGLGFVSHAKKLDQADVYCFELMPRAMTDQEIATTLTELAAALQRRPPIADYRDWVSAFVEGDAIGTDEAAFIACYSAQKIRRQATKAAETDKPLGVWFAQSVWLISKARLLDAIEEREGRPGRLAAMSRAAKYAEMRPPQQNSIVLDSRQQDDG